MPPGGEVVVLVVVLLLGKDALSAETLIDDTVGTVATADGRRITGVMADGKG